jgi:hypothetical protein
VALLRSLVCGEHKTKQGTAKADPNDGNGGGKTTHVFCLLSVQQVDLLGAQT